jgi:hypothetical protein
MFEGQHRLYIGDFSDPSTTAEHKQMIPDYPTIEAFYRGERSPELLRRQNDTFGPSRHFAAMQQSVAFGCKADIAIL